ncbi:ketoacyl-ACP synthase III [uncultured Mailhella sp.]|uniref:ketoacyl-ACP synthase III n=1 Tax=uncultured Mailhella sp. TaxID=1981031 RepID=UPI0026339FAA|nr:ketoacyl-ACP synthase III [uncultured Mailhella sp.]
MAFLHFDNVRIAALAGALPEHVQKVNMDPAHPRAAYIAQFVKQTGVRQRHISITQQTATDVGYAAVVKALERAGWEAGSLDGLIFLTQTPDFNVGTGNAFVMHNHLGMSEDAFVFDITQGCASFPYGLSVCAALLQQPHIKRIAMVTGDAHWQKYRSRAKLLASSCFLHGEGCTALLLENANDSPLDISLHSDGTGYHFLYNPWGGVRHAWRKVPGILPTGEMYKGGGNYMDGMEITSFSTIRVVDSIKDFLKKQNKTVDDYDGLVLHQANKQIVKTMARRLKADMSKVPMTVDRLANTDGASATLTMVDAYAGSPRERLNLLVSAFGIGLSWGVVSLSIEPSVIVPMVTTSHRFDEDFLKPLEK